MSVAPGNNFKLTDLQALATQANAVSSTSFDLSTFYYVYPMFYDLSSSPYGYRICGAFALTARGSGYAVGDIVVSPGYTTYFEVGSVDITGAIIGLVTYTNSAFSPSGDLTTTPPFPSYTDPAPGALNTVTGSGTGATITFTVSQVGPSQNYSFPDYNPGNGYFTNFYLCFGGTGYTAGDNLTLPGAKIVGGSPVPVHVVSVDGSGKILTFTLPNTTYIGFLQYLSNTPQYLAASGGTGSGATFGGLFIVPQRPTWLAELNRLRSAIWGLKDLDDSSTFMNVTSPSLLCVSGPWPVSGPNDNYASTWFYFEDTGGGATVTISSNFPGSGPFSAGLRTNAVCSMLLSTFPPSPYYYPVTTKQRQAFVVGGVDSLFVSGTFHITAEYVRGGTAVITYPGPTTTITPDTVDPNTLWSVNLSPSGGYNAFPGSVSYSTSVADTGFCSIGIVEISIAVSATLAPGRYELEVDIPQLPDDTSVPITGTQTTYTRLFPNGTNPLDDGSGGNGKLFGPVTASISYSTAVTAYGIDNAWPIKKINLPGDGLSHGPGLLFVQDIPNNNWNYGAGPTFPAITYDPEKIFGNGWSIGTSKAGFWSSMSPAISSLAIPSLTSMPWNLTRTKYAVAGNATVNPMLQGDLAPNGSGMFGAYAQVSNSYNQLSPVESQSEPPSWAASIYFTSGFTIIDSNGNYQTVFTGGISGGSHPVWSGAFGGSTTDNGVVWHCSKVFTAPATTWIASTVFQSGQTIIDSNGNIETAQNTGTSNSSAPAWPGTLGGTVTDNTITWKFTSRYQAFQPGQHRIPPLPRYPVYWYSETIPRMMPPTLTSGNTIWGAYDQWQYNTYNSPSFDQGWHQVGPTDTPAKGKAYGWWIYSVSINRIASTAGTVAVTLGCIRSSVFSPFATYNTGTTNQVLWPIFTSDALVYQCSERVDVQALAIASTNSVSQGQVVQSPICAAFVTDTSALISLIT